MKRILFLFSFVALLMSLGISCSVDPDQLDPTKIDLVENEVLNPGYVKQSHPYGVSSMQAAYDYLSMQTRSGLDDVEITASHYHVRFRPATEEQSLQLKLDTTIVLYYFPLDHSVPDGDSGYRDPEQPDDAPLFMFAAVEVDYEFHDGIPYDILEELFIPEESDEFSDEFSATLLNASFSLIGGGLGGGDLGGGSGGIRPFDPGGLDNPGGGDEGGGGPAVVNHYQGRVRVYDDLLNRYVPIKNIKVKIRRNWFTSRTAKTDSEGRFVCNKNMGTPVDYMIDWEGTHFDIRSAYYKQAVCNRHNRGREMNMDLKYGVDRMYATIYRAANRYFNEYIMGLNRPNALNRTLKIRYLDEYHEKRLGYFVGDAPLTADIWIYGKDYKGGHYMTNELFATTCHEMGHAAHYWGVGSAWFLLTEERLYESWATFVEYILTIKEYQDLGANEEQLQKILYNMGKQNWESEGSSSPLFIDLYDDYNQRVERNDVGLPDDNVTGYTPAALKNILYDCNTYVGLKSRLKNNKPSGVTNAQLDTLFKRHNELWKNY